MGYSRINGMKTPAKLMTIFIAAGAVIVGSFLILNYSPKPDLYVEVLKGMTSEASGGIEFVRIKVTNYSGRELTNVIVDMGPDDKHSISRIRAGESILITPKSEAASVIVITTNEGISVTKYLDT